MASNIRKPIDHALPSDDSDQYDIFKLIKKHSEMFNQLGPRVLDLGCGSGKSHDNLKKLLPGLAYVGVDIASSPEVENRTRNDLEFRTFNGIDLPFEDASFDIIFCKQVLEHVRHPDRLVAETNRVLRPGGVFVGSVSCLEPYHSFSIFNWKAYGIVSVFEDNGYSVKELRPGIDGISLTMRDVFGKDRVSKSFFHPSMYNHFIETESNDRDVKTRNFLKLKIAGHISFIAEKAS